MKSFFKDLFDYSHYYNQKIAEVFTSNPYQATERSVLLFSHILNAHQVWNCRIKGEQNTFGVWDKHTIQDFDNIEKINYENTMLVLDQYDMNQTLHYTNTKGQQFSNTIRDILFHVINHSTYHRGQIATEFRQSGLEPIATDYIMYKR